MTNPVEIDSTANTVKAQQSGAWNAGIAHIHATVALREGRTFFTCAGDYFAYLCAGALVLSLVATVRGRLRRRPA